MFKMFKMFRIFCMNCPTDIYIFKKIWDDLG